MVKDHRKKGIERKVFTIENFERTRADFNQGMTQTEKSGSSF